MSQKLILICGKSGVGKDLALNHLTTISNKWKPIVSVTTRPIRPSEVQNREYFFCTKRQFEAMITRGFMLEWREYPTKFNGEEVVYYYGTEKYQPNKYNITIATLENIKAFRKHFGRDNVSVIYISTPDEVREERSKARGGHCDIEWNRRVEADAKDFNEKVVTKNCDFFIQNNGDDNKFKVMLKEVLDIIEIRNS